MFIVHKYLKLSLMFGLFLVYMFSLPACHADIIVFPDNNAVTPMPQPIEPQNGFENYIKRPLNNPNLIEQEEQLKMQKDYLRTLENQSYYNNFPYYNDYYNSYNTPYIDINEYGSENPPHPLNYDETILPPLGGGDDD